MRIVQLGGEKAPPPSADKTRDRFLDQWLIARGDRLHGLVTEALVMIDHEELASGIRQRKRRGKDLKTHEALVENTVANLAYAVIDRSEPQTIAVSLSKAKRPTRYERHIFKLLPRLLPILSDHDLLTFTKSTSLGRRSTIAPTAWFSRKVKAARIGFEDFGRSELEESIVLSHSSDGFKPDGTFGKRRHLVDYKYDTDDTRRFRSEIARINEFLAEADLEFVPDAGSKLVIEPRKGRTLHRTFNLPSSWQEGDAPRFDLGGRLFGGWWENLPREERHRIRIDGEAVVDLDFASMFPRLAFLELGLEPPAGDLYAIPGLENPKYRDGVKGMMNTLLFATGPKLKMPSEFKKQLPKGWTATDVRKAIVDKYPGLEQAFEVGLGLELMFDESQILVAILLRLIDEKIVTLAMHDGLIAPSSKKARVRTVMEEVAKEVTGFRLPTGEKRL